MTARPTRLIRRHGPASAAVLLLLSALGCASSAPSTGGDLRRGPGPVAGTEAGSPLLAATTALVAPERSLAVATEPGVQERLLSVRARPAAPTNTQTPDPARPGQPYVVEKTILRPGAGAGPGAGDGAWAADAKSLQRLEMRVTTEGALVLERTTETADAVVTEFDPPMLVLPARLEPGASVSQPLKMVVRPIADPSKVRTSGEATQEVTYEGDERLSVPAGEFRARRVRSVLSAQLGQARVVATTITWYADGVGQVAEFREEAVTVLGVRIRHAARTWAALPPSP